ncbi:LacI family transcriptional regulator/LacI family purine nucleotide synthesis repressor [Paenibacillus endophyticus]|uniref:LacI family transcriptional regulator/LacI family purine nucleotide synthesis repressor n=1 Tax=Paenibacillus endophyticus TaxID=1294268 RepID=A0A7W5GB63_9BACL|nr:LacI family transcriptional regulator/LacI family purine nucleotide synthesis repressor [Paenibacillus endophyticus]
MNEGGAAIKPVTVYDIAREANVSVATVSRVINNTAPVKKSTRERIMELIAKHQFQPNALARSLYKKETGMIGVILPDITNPFFPEVLAGLDQEARSKGYTFFLCDTVSTNGDSAEQYVRESQYLSILMEKQVDGIVMIGGRINLAKPSKELIGEVVEASKRVPLLLINGNLPGEGMTRVYADELEGAELATQHLIELGHERIAFVGGYKHMSNTVQRIKGFVRTMERSGLQARKEWIMDGGFSVESGKAFMNRMLALPERPTAIFCANDLVAIGVMKAAHKAGIRVPEELSLIGFDDIPYASNSIPELTTVSLRCYDVGRHAAELLHQMITKSKVSKNTKIRPELIVRESTARPPARTETASESTIEIMLKNND